MMPTLITVIITAYSALVWPDSPVARRLSYMMLLRPLRPARRMKTDVAWSRTLTIWIVRFGRHR
jgi:hypothetical protein